MPTFEAEGDEGRGETTTRIVGPGTPATVVALDPDQASHHLDALAEILVDAVEGGASVSFMLPFGPDQARAFWQGVIRSVAAGEAALLVALAADGRPGGTVQLRLATPPNQPHRADIAKLLVHRRARRQGLGRALVLAAEAEALARGRTLLTLDTIACGAADRLYQDLGFVRVGEIPGYARMPAGGEPRATAIFYKKLAIT